MSRLGSGRCKDGCRSGWASAHPNAIRRAASIADGWMGAGGSSTDDFRKAVPLLREALEKAGRDPDLFPVSKRIFVAIDERSEIARAELLSLVHRSLQ